MIKDSGKREEFASGAVRDTQENKGRCDLLPLDCLPNKYATDPVMVLLNEFKKYGKYSFVENAREYFIRKAFPNVETSLLELSVHYQEGAAKYGDNNWQKGLPTSRYISSAIRHYAEYCRGDNDEPHARAVIWNLTAIIWTCKHKPQLNDYAKPGLDSNSSDTVMHGLCTTHLFFDELERFPQGVRLSSESLKDAMASGMSPNEYLRQRAAKAKRPVASKNVPRIVGTYPKYIIFDEITKFPSEEEAEKFADYIARALGVAPNIIKGGVK